MLSLFKVFMSEDVLEPINKVLMSGQLTQGPKVEEFESVLKKYIENPYILTLNSATAGLTLATRLLKNKDEEGWPGFDEEKDIVLTPALTCFATTAAILANNVNIRWLDVDLQTCNIDLNDLKNKLNEKTKIIYLVHWGGNPVDLDELDKICEDHKITYGFKPMVVEDCAHSFGAEYDGKKIGSNKNICVFSLQAIKHLTTGDGGFITLPNEELYNMHLKKRLAAKAKSHARSASVMDSRNNKNDDNNTSRSSTTSSSSQNIIEEICQQRDTTNDIENILTDNSIDEYDEDELLKELQDDNNNDNNEIITPQISFPEVPTNKLEIISNNNNDSNTGSSTETIITKSKIIVPN